MEFDGAMYWSCNTTLLQLLKTFFSIQVTKEYTVFEYFLLVIDHSNLTIATFDREK